MGTATDDARTVTGRLIEEVMNRGRLELIDDLIDEGAVDHEELPIASGEMRTDLRMWLTELRRAFPDYHVEVEDLIAEDDKVVARERITGTNLGPLMGIPPTGRQICVAGIDIMRIRDGRVVEHWGMADSQAMARQLGLSAIR